MLDQNRKHSAIRVYVTERCNANCKSCFNAMSRTNAEMSIENFSELCKYLKENGITYLKIMGGEPTVHKDFEKIIDCAQRFFDGISLFTNGINDRIANVKFRDSDSVIFNFSFNKLLNEERFHFENGGKRNLEIQLHHDTDEIEFANRILDIANLNRDKIHITLTLDCTSNIFLEKMEIVKKLQYIENRLITGEYCFGYDHRMPLCYLYNTGLHPSSDGMCNFFNSGLIDSDMKLRFCNQHSGKILNLVQNGKFVPWVIVRNHLYKFYCELQASALNKVCLNCIFYNNNCNGGCWVANEKISREDILRNIDFPLQNNGN